MVEENQEDPAIPKIFYKSKTLIGVVVAVLPQLLPVFGLSFSADDAVLINGTVDAVISAVGGLFAVYGRFVVSESLRITP